MLELKNISKMIDDRLIINNISIKFPSHGFIGIKGESGCGKSSLLYIIGMLDDDFIGNVIFNNHEVIDKEQFRRDYISYMMQNKDFITSMSVKENILLSNYVSQIKYSRSRLKKIVKQLKIDDLLYRYPDTLSGGQLKRVSIAKALIKDSPIILCDEPTGALHSQASHEVMKLLKSVSKEKLVIIVSHDPQLLDDYCDNVLILKNGKLLGELGDDDKCEIPIIKRKRYPLSIYSIRQLCYQKNKLLLLFLFQWIFIGVFFVMVTGVNGLMEAIDISEKQSVLAHTITIENKDRTLFDNPTIIENAQYNYHLDLLEMTSSTKEIEASLAFLPNDTSHIVLKEGVFPQKDNEVLITDALNKKLENSELTLFFEETSMKMKVVGIIEPSLFQGNEIYLSPLFKQSIPHLIDQYSLIVESDDVMNLYYQLNQKYSAYSDVIERVENYQSLLSLTKVVAGIFIGVSLMISLIFIFIVQSILYYERKHDIAYLYSLGLSYKKMKILSFIEAVILSLFISLGGCFLSIIIYIYMNDVYCMYHKFNFELLLKPFIYDRWDLFVFIIMTYMIIVVLSAFRPVALIKKMNMIEILREE